MGEKKRKTLQWVGHIERVVGRVCGKVYLNKIEGQSSRGNLLERGKDGVQESKNKEQWYRVRA